MFMPKTLYEKAPYYWIVLGALLIAFGIYYGVAGNREYLIAGIGGGMFACIWGSLVLRRRLAREARQPCSTYDEYLDQTCELNLRSGPLSDSELNRTRH
jgi:hypothetical protein